MSDTPPAPTNDDPGAGDGFTPPASQDELDRMIQSRIARERAKFDDYEDLKAKAAKFDEAENAKKDATTRAAEAQAAAEQQAAEAQARALRLEVAYDKGLPKSLATRLTGSSREELEADADTLLELLPAGGSGDGSSTPPPDRQPRRDLRGGNDPTPDSTAATAADVRAAIDRIPRHG